MSDLCLSVTDFTCINQSQIHGNVFQATLIIFAWKNLKTMAERRLQHPDCERARGVKGHRGEGSLGASVGWQADMKLQQQQDGKLTFEVTMFLLFLTTLVNDCVWKFVWSLWARVYSMCVCVCVCLVECVCVSILSQRGGETDSRQEQSAVVLCLWLSSKANPFWNLTLLHTERHKGRKQLKLFWEQHSCVFILHKKCYKTSFRDKVHWPLWKFNTWTMRRIPLLDLKNKNVSQDMCPAGCNTPISESISK